MNLSVRLSTQHRKLQNYCQRISSALSGNKKSSWGACPHVSYSKTLYVMTIIIMRGDMTSWRCGINDTHAIQKLKQSKYQFMARWQWCSACTWTHCI